jgi:hypothetical protein
MWIAAACWGAVAMMATACGDEEKASPTGEPLPDRLVASLPAPRGGPQAAGTYVAAAAGDGAPYVAIVLQGNEVLAFVCDGDEVGEPLGGTTSGSGFELSRNGVRLSGTLRGEVVTGELTVPDAGVRAFTARPAVEGTTGLYRAEATVDGDEVVTWWIQGEERVKGARVDRRGKRGFETADPQGFEGAVVGEAPPR